MSASLPDPMQPILVGVDAGATKSVAAAVRPDGEPDAGVIREGGPADLVLVHGDPLSDPAALWRAWHSSWA